MKKIQTFIAALILVAMGAFVLIPASAVGAVGALDNVCTGSNANTPVCQQAQQPASTSNSFVTNLVNTLLFIVGAISVIMIILGAILYVTSGGDSSNITKAKNTILYSVVGLVVAILAYAIVNWVVVLFWPPHP